MVEKKEVKAKKIVKPTIKKNIQQEEGEQRYFAKDLASKMGIDSFEFLLIKRAANLNDDSIIAVSEMQKLYNEVVRR